MDWNEILSDVEDINDPTIYEKVLIAIDDIYCEDEDFMQLLISKLDNMHVTWEQPWYQTSLCLTRCTVANCEDDEKREKFRTTHFTKKECEQIKENWANFIEEYEVPDMLQSFARWKNRDCKNPSSPHEKVRRFVTAYLAQGLERNMHQVYQYVVKHFGTPVKGNYSDVEKKLFNICFYFNEKHAVKNLSLLLGRDPRGIYKQLHQMNEGKPEKKKLKWTLPLATKFVNLLLKYSNGSLEELKYKRFDKSVWLQLESDMDQQYQYLQKSWYNALHVQIFVKQDVKMNRLRKKIIRILRDSPYEVWRDICWKDLPKHFPDGFTHTFLYKNFTCLLAGKTDYLKQPLPEVLDYILHKVNTGRKNKRLRTLSYENGNLELISYKKKDSQNQSMEE
ncbi:uncharacterized protein LOC106709283 [Papilio machaon]|uniref:uncharacterized protein LOC106709283 n=1 Tax=Papilio machaon TaxID=76193 RepID=UPI001E662CBE|nr:uncharacterized protein LOC106709283 [Papilio machaon]